MCAFTSAVVATLAIVAGVGSTTAPASVAQLGCGAIITTDTTLDSDLTSCPSNGIVIGADNITLDLNGHTVGGDGVPTGSCFDDGICDLGISNDAGHSGVTITGGTVRGFDIGTSVVGGSENRIQRVALANNSTFGVSVGDSTAIRIEHNSSVNEGISGIVMFDSRAGRIEHNSVTGAHGYAIAVFGSSHNRLEHNLLDGNDHGILLDSCDGNEVHGNRISHSGGSSIDMGHSSENRVGENVLRDNGDGVILFEANANLINDNSVKGTGLFGFPDAGGFGLILDGADDNVVLRNDVTGGNGPAIFVTSLESQGTSDRNVISHDVVNSRFSDGILVNGDATATLLEHNTAVDNGHDGIEVAAAGTTVTRNTADFNHDLGIEAVLGVIDGGGNRARGNGNPLQCTNVAC